MGKTLAPFVFLLLALAAAAQDLPPRPSCTPLFAGGACQALWNQYNQAVLQYNAAQQRESAMQPLQAEIANLNTQVVQLENRVRQLLDQQKTDAQLALRAKDDAAQDAMFKGVFFGAAGSLVALVLGFAIKKMVEMQSR